MKTKLIIRK